MSDADLVRAIAATATPGAIVHPRDLEILGAASHFQACRVLRNLSCVGALSIQAGRFEFRVPSDSALCSGDSARVERLATSRIINNR